MGFKKIISQNTEINRIQDEVSRELNRLSFLNFFSSGKLIEEVVIGTSPTEITHGLGQTVRGWFLVKQDTNTTVWAPSTATATPNQTINLQASSACTVSLIVF